MSSEQFLLTAHFYFETRDIWLFSVAFDVFCYISAVFRAFLFGCNEIFRKLCPHKILLIMWRTIKNLISYLWYVLSLDWFQFVSAVVDVFILVWSFFNWRVVAFQPSLLLVL